MRQVSSSNLLGLLLLLYALTQLSSTVECRRNRSSSIKPRRGRKGVSRLMYGVKEASTLPWLGTLWHNFNNTHKQSDGRLAGLVLYIARGKFIASYDAVSHVNQDKPRIVDSVKGYQPSQIVLATPAVFDVNKGVPGYDEALVQQGFSGLEPLPHRLELFKVKRKLDSRDEAIPSSYPILESNKTELGSNCRLYGWSKKPHSHDNTTDDRYFVSFGVRIRPNLLGNRSCDNETHICLLGVEDDDIGQVCLGTTDVGAPILCGADRKLTYLVIPQNSVYCVGNIKVLHVPNIYETLIRGIKNL